MKNIFIAFTVILSIAHIKAQQTNKELQQLIGESFGYFPKLQEVQQIENINLEKLRLSKSNQMPTLNGNISYNYINPISEATLPIGQGITRALQFQPNNNFNANLTANYVLLDFGRLKTTIEKAKQELSYSKINTDYNKTQLAAQVANIYYNIIYLKKAIQVQDSIINYYEETKLVIESKLKQGDALKVDLFTIASTIDQEKNRQVDLQNSFQKQLNLLQYTTGKNQISGTEFQFNYIDTSVEAYLSLANDRNSEYALANSKVLMAKSDLSYNKRLLTPTLNATASAGFRNGYQPDIFANRFNYLAGLSLNIPIYTGGKNRTQINIASQSLKQNEMSINSLQNQFKKDIKQVLLDIESNEEKLKNSESQINASKAIVALTQSRYNNGVATYLDIIYATNGMQRAYLNQIQLQFQLTMAKIELARLTGEKYW